MQDDDNSPHDSDEYLPEPSHDEDHTPIEMGKNDIPSEKSEDKIHRPSLPNPEDLFILPLNRRPFFPGMAAPVVIEQGTYYEVLKMIAKD